MNAAFGGEKCDGTALAGKSCSDLDGDGVREPGDFDGGTLSCLPVTCQLNTAGCYACGDGVKNGLEDCDGVGACGGAVQCDDKQCTDFGFASTSGLACTVTCSFDFSGCDTSTCGNGTIDGAEVCDTAALGGKRCDDLDGDGTLGEAGDFAGGTLACRGDCTLDISLCEYCGDGIKNGTEACDGLATGGKTCVTEGFLAGGQLGCLPNCSAVDISGCAECDTCLDCPDDEACVDHRCGACRITTDCCAPLECIGGVCTLW